MSHPSEDILEAYALDPHAHPGEVVASLTSHLEQCAACREWLEYLRSFYEKFRRLPFSASRSLQGLVESLRPPATVFDLRPFQRWGPGTARPVRRTTILAAASDTISATRYHRLGVLSSEEEGVVLRLIYDAHNDVVDVFLIASEPRKREHAIISFPVLHLECVTDLEGKSRFRGVKEVREIEWATQYAVVRLPMCEIALRPSGETRQSIGEPESHLVTATVDAASVSVWISPLAKQTRPITTALLTDNGNIVSTIHLADGRGSVPLDGSSSRLILRFYN
jgi:hypothetical protein